MATDTRVPKHLHLRGVLICHILCLRADKHLRVIHITVAFIFMHEAVTCKSNNGD